MKSFAKLLIALFVLSFTLNAYADRDPYKPFGEDEFKVNVKFKEDHKKALKEFNYRSGKPVAFYVDFQLGVGSTTPNITTTTGTVVKEEAKLGYTVGGLVYMNVFGLLNFTTGLSFDGKSFGFQKPSVSGSTGSGTSADTSAKSGYLPANYLTIPLFLNIGGMVSEDVGLWFTGGPYMGFLMSQPSNTYGNIGYKNFDLGLDATLTANYVFLYPFSVIFGTTFKYGGLNNLMSSQSVEKITTSNFTFFSGVRFAL